MSLNFYCFLSAIPFWPSYMCSLTLSFLSYKDSIYYFEMLFAGRCIETGIENLALICTQRMLAGPDDLDILGHAQGIQMFVGDFCFA